MNEYREGRMNLVGQHKPAYLLDALDEREKALDDFNEIIDRMPDGGVNSDPAYESVYFAAAKAYQMTVEYADEMHDRWGDEQYAARMEAERIPVVMPVNVKESIDNFSSK